MAALFVLGETSPARAWGCTVHRLIGAIAAARLSPATQAAIDTLTNDESLAEQACWADEIRPARPETKRWHYVDIQRGASAYDPARDCASEEQGDCLLAALERFTAQLRDRELDAAARTEALRFVVHLVGDLYQPLHCTDDRDKGGNQVAVRFLGRPYNLHAVWDTALLEAVQNTSPNARVRIAAAARAIAPAPIDFVAWAMETHAVGVAHVYGDLPADRVLDERYVRDHAAVVEQQIARAGARLGDVLNAALGASHPTATTTVTPRPAPAARRPPRRSARRALPR